MQEDNKNTNENLEGNKTEVTPEAESKIQSEIQSETQSETQSEVKTENKTEAKEESKPEETHEITIESKSKNSNKKTTAIVAVVLVVILAVVVIFTVSNSNSSSSSGTSNNSNETSDEEIDTTGIEFEVFSDSDTDEYDDGTKFTSDAWPCDELFPDVPAFSASSYDVDDEGTKMTITLGADDYQNIDSYIQTLEDAGANVDVNNDQLAVLTLGDVEIQITKAESGPQLVLCGEEEVEISNETFADYPLPDNGRIVEANLAEDSDNIMYVKMRCLSYSEALDYCQKLIKYGWDEETTAPDSENPQTFLAKYTLGVSSITVDFHNGSADCNVIISTVITSSDSSTQYDTDKVYYQESTGEYVKYNADGTKYPVDKNDYPDEEIVTIESHEAKG